VVGAGTRFLPATKTIPKERLPIVDKPIIQLAIEELVEVQRKPFEYSGEGSNPALL
jgi:UTP--glucose-1-phosphate uridylyltransferase